MRRILGGAPLSLGLHYSLGLTSSLPPSAGVAPGGFTARGASTSSDRTDWDAAFGDVKARNERLGNEEASLISLFRHNPQLWRRIKGKMGGEGGGTELRGNFDTYDSAKPSKKKFVVPVKADFVKDKTTEAKHHEGVAATPFSGSSRVSWGVTPGSGHYFISVDITGAQDAEFITLKWTPIPDTDFVVKLVLIAHPKENLKPMFCSGHYTEIGHNLSAKKDEESEEDKTKLLFSFDPAVNHVVGHNGKKTIVSDIEGKPNANGDKPFYKLCDNYPGTCVKLVVLRE